MLGSDRKLKKDLCVVGHGRGATSYAAYWLIKQDVRVEHERMGPQGVVESGFSVPTWGCRGGVSQGLTRDQFEFKNRVCILRDPHKTIATYEQVEHPRAIFAHAEHIHDLCNDLLPDDYSYMSPEVQLAYLEKDRVLRVNTIARSVVRWTQEGVNWAGEAFRAEDEWDENMPTWLKDRGLWTLPDLTPCAVVKNQINHRMGQRLTFEEINTMLRSDVLDELADYRERMGYDG
jgi:hypothetical protein